MRGSYGMIEFRTLGFMDLRGEDGGALHSLLAQPKRMGLLAYLCIARPRGFHRRDTILGLFWPDADQTHARNSLRNALHIVRRTIGEEAIISRGDEEVGIDTQRIRCDAVELDRLVADRSPEEALALYQGDLLPGFFIDEAPGFERWLQIERDRLGKLAAEAANSASKRSEQAGDLPSAIRFAQRGVELGDTDEPGWRRLVELLEKAGDRAGALDAARVFSTKLAADYGAEPSLETRALFDRLREKTDFARPPPYQIRTKPPRPFQNTRRMFMTLTCGRRRILSSRWLARDSSDG